MKIFSFVAVALWLTLTSPAADAPVVKGRKPLDEATLKKYDANGDGKLDANEQAVMRRDLKKTNKADRKNPAPQGKPGLADPGVPLVPTK